MTKFRSLVATALSTFGLSVLIIAVSFISFDVFGVTESTDYEARYIRAVWGTTAYLSLASNLLLAARLSFVDDIFGGLDKAYKQHRQLGILAMISALMHYWSPPVFLEKSCNTPPCNELLGPSILAGQASLGLLIIFGVMSTIRRYNFKGWQIPYGVWKSLHWLMLVVFLAATYHLLQMPKMPLGYRNFATFLGYVGISALLIYLVGHVIRLRRSYSYEVVSLVRQGDVIIIDARPMGPKLMHRAGQFAFLKFRAKGLKEAHPFTISSGPQEEQIQFCIKAVGDFTRNLHSNLKVGVEARIEGPYGRFAKRSYAKETWIAAGIGITPFLSLAKSRSLNEGETVDLVHICRNTQDLIGQETLEIFSKKKGVHVHTHLSSEDGRWQPTMDISNDAVPFFCGPKSLLKIIRKKSKTVKTEEFEFT